MPATTVDETADEGPEGTPRPSLQLVVAWSFEDPSRIGEVFDLAPGRVVIGRDPGAHRPVRVRPGGLEWRPPVGGPRISRRHLEVSRHGGSWLTVRRIGRNSVVVDDQALDEGGALRVTTGSWILLSGRLLLLVAPAEPLVASPGALHRFGEPDEHGIVGESAAAWRLRSNLATLGAKAPHVLVQGESGVGKELAARALHAVSARSRSPFVARNAAMFPEGLIEAELVGNVRNYPNPGMAERQGLLGAADGGTLFLDEVGDLPLALQPTLLRVMDAGEYQRLGEARTRQVDVRFLGATNKPTGSLRTDLAARFEMRLAIPPLRERQADIPLILRRVAVAACAEDPALAGQLLDENGEPKVRCRWVAGLLTHPLPTNVRGIREAFWRAVAELRPGEPLDGPVASLAPVEAEPGVEPPSPTAFRDPQTIGCDEVRQVMADTASVAEAVRVLRVKDRHVLKRLRQRCGLL